METFNHFIHVLQSIMELRTHTILVVWFYTAFGRILVEGMAGGSLCAWLCAQEVQPGEERVVQWRGPYSIRLVVQQFCPSIPVPNTSWWVDGWNKQAHDCQYLQSIELWQHGVFFIKHTSIAAGGALKTSSERQQQKQKISFSHNPHRQTVGMSKFREASFFPQQAHPTHQYCLLAYQSVFSFHLKSHPIPLWPLFLKLGLRRSSFRLRLERQNSFTFTALLLMGRPIPLLALRAAVARHLASATDVELSQLKKQTKTLLICSSESRKPHKNSLSLRRLI